MKKSKKILLISLLPALLVLVFILNILMPAYYNMNSIQDKLQIKKNEFTKLKAKMIEAEDDKKLIADVATLSQKLAGFEINVPEKHELEVLLIDLDRFAEKNDVQITGLDAARENEIEIKDPKDEISQKTKSKSSKKGRKKITEELPVKLFEIPLEIKIIGFYPNVLDFINDIEKYQRIITTSGIRISDSQKVEATSFPRVNMTIYSKAYRVIEQEVESTAELDTSAKSNSKSEKEVKN